MHAFSQLSVVSVYLKKYWFRIALVCLAIVLFLKKDFTLSFNFNTPEDIPAKVAPPQEKKEKPVVFTDKTIVPKKEKSLLSIFSSGSSAASTVLADALAQQNASTIHAHIKRFGHVAQSEQQKFGIPASIIMATSLLHSTCSQHRVAKEANNYFLLQCSPVWNGATLQQNSTCYRAYENAWTSFRDHSTYLSSPKFSNTKQLSISDYKSWAKALENANYSEEGNLAQQLIRIIESYQLYELDQA